MAIITRALLFSAALLQATANADPPAAPPPQQPPPPETRALVLCLGQVVDFRDETRDQDDIPEEILSRARYVGSLQNASGCDLLITLREVDTGGWDWDMLHAEAISPVSGFTMWTNEEKSYHLNDDFPDVLSKVEAAFAPGTPLRQRLIAEREATAPSAPPRPARAAVVKRPQNLPTEARQKEIVLAEKNGDAALKAGNRKRAFQSYTQALSGALADDEASRRARQKYMKLLSGYRPMPGVPEEARRHMVRAKAMIKESQSPNDLENAFQEMAQAVGAAPWWTDAYYNLGLVAEKRGYVADAIDCLKWYLVARPKASDARAVKDRIYELELRLEAK